MKPYTLVEARDGQGRMLQVPGRGKCPVGSWWRFVPRQLRPLWWIGFYARRARWNLTH